MIGSLIVLVLEVVGRKSPKIGRGLPATLQTIIARLRTAKTLLEDILCVPAVSFVSLILMGLSDIARLRAKDDPHDDTQPGGAFPLRSA